MKLICVVLLMAKICQSAITKDYHEFISATTSDLSSATTGRPDSNVKKSWSLNNIAAVNPMPNNLDDSEGSNKEKRCPQELLQSVHRAMLKRRELNQQDMLKKKCQSCKESILCNGDNCSHCQSVCTGLNDDEQTVKMENRMIDNNSGLSSKDNRYFTIGAFDDGAVQKLILRLLSVQNADSIGRLIVLAEMKGKGKDNENKAPKNPLIIDIARVLSTSNSSKIDIQLQNVKDTISKDQMRIIYAVNGELDKALDVKKRNGDEPHLTPIEIEEAINKALSLIDTTNDPKVGSRNFENKDVPESREAFENENMQFVTDLPPPLSKPSSDNHKLSSTKQVEANPEELPDNFGDKLTKHVVAGKGKVEELPLKKRKYTSKYIYDKAEKVDEDVAATQSPSEISTALNGEKWNPVSNKVKEVPAKKKTKYHYTVDDDNVGVTGLPSEDTTSSNTKALKSVDHKSKQVATKKKPKYHYTIDTDDTVSAIESQSKIPSKETEAKPDAQFIPQSYEEYHKLLKIIKDNIDRLPDDQQTDVKRLIENQPRGANDGKSDVIVGLENMKPIHTKMTQQEIEEASKKIEPKQLNEDEILAARPFLYSKHPRLLPTKLNAYGNKYGKANHNKVVIVGDPQENIENNPNVGNTPAVIESDSTDGNKRPTFIDPKLINMDSVIQDLREAPNAFLDRTSKFINILKSNKAEKVADNMVAEANDDMTGKEKKAEESTQGGTDDEVGCSKESSEEIMPIFIHHPVPSYGGRGYGHKSDYDRAADETENESNVGLQKTDEDISQQKLDSDGANVKEDISVKERMMKPSDSGIVASQMDWMPNEPVPESIPANSQLFGKFIPDKKTSVIDHKYNIKDKPNNMYYVGENVKLPVLMKQHNDGSYHVAVDIDKLCNCKDGNCTGIIGHGKDENGENEQIKMPLPDPLNQRIASSLKKREITDSAYLDTGIAENTLNGKTKDVSNEEDDIKYKFNCKSGFYDLDPVINRIELAKKMLSWVKNVVTDGEQE